MGFIDRLKHLFGAKSYDSQSFSTVQNARVDFDANGRILFWPVGFDRFQYNERNFREFVYNGYGKNPYIFMVIDRICNLLKNIPVLLVDDDGNLIQDARWESLKAKTNDRDSWEEYIYRLCSSYLATGNGLTYGTAPLGFNEYQLLNVALPQNTVIQTQGGAEWGLPVAYSITNQYGEGVVDADRMLHIIKPNIINDSNFGLSNLYSGQPIYTGSNNTFTARASIHDNKGASGIISPKHSDDVLSGTEKDQLNRAWNKRNSGASNTGKIDVTAVPIDYTQIGMSAVDMQLVQMNPQDLRNACALYSVPSVLFGDVEGTTFSNMKEAKESIYTDAVLPLGDDIYEQLSVFLIQENWGIDGKLVLDKSAIEVFKKNKNEEHDRVRADVQAGIITAEEARTLLYPSI